MTHETKKTIDTHFVQGRPCRKIVSLFRLANLEIGTNFMAYLSPNNSAID